MKTQTLYRPVGPAELALIEASGWKEFPPRLPDQPIFYPIMNEEYALQIARCLTNLATPQRNFPATKGTYA